MNEDNSVRYWIEKGNSLLKKKDDRTAIECYTKAIALDPQCALAFYNRSLVFASNGDYDRAERDRDEAIRLDPSIAAHWSPLAEATSSGFVCMANDLISEGDFQTALERYRDAVRFNPSNADAHMGCGLAHYELGDTRSAIKAFDEALERDPKYVECLFNRAIAFASQREYARAIEDLTLARTLDPNQAEVSELLAAYTGEKRLHEQARSECQSEQQP